MKFEDLTVGSCVKWTANRMFKSWDTYGVIISKTEDEFVIQTYDDFKETTLHKGGDALHNEITLCNMEDVSDYLHLSIGNLQTKKVELEVTFKNEVRLIDKQTSKILKHIAFLGFTNKCDLKVLFNRDEE